MAWFSRRSARRKHGKYPLRETREIPEKHRFPVQNAARHLFMTKLSRDMALPHVLAPLSHLIFRKDMNRARWWMGAEITRAFQRDKEVWKSLERWDFADVDARGNVLLNNEPKADPSRIIRLRVADIMSGQFVRRSFEHPVKRILRGA